MKIDIVQIWEYEFKPTDTFRLLHAFKNIWENQGDEITLERRGNKIFAVRRAGVKENSLDHIFGKDLFEGFPSIRKED